MSSPGLLPDPCLLAVTDRARLSPNWTLAQAIAPAITGGCNLVLFRETDLPEGPRLVVARFCLDGIKGRVPMITAGDPLFSAKAGAAGIHSDDVSDVGPQAPGAQDLLGVSIRTVEEAQRAEAAGADYLLIEYNWDAPDRVLKHFENLRGSISTNLIAGADPPLEWVPKLREVGASGVAVCSAAMSAYDRTAACRAFAEALRA